MEQESPVRLGVHGEATFSVRPERADLRLAVGFTGSERASVVRRTVEAHARVAEEAAAHRAAGAASWWGSERVGASAYQEYVKDSDTRVTRYRAAASVRARFADFEVLSRWVTDLAEREGVTVAAVDWDLTQATRRRLRGEARTAALRDAVERAGDYAAALGLGPVRLLAVYEDGLRPDVVAGGGATLAPMSARRAAATTEGGGGLSLTPGDIDVTDVLSADFEAGPR